MAETTGEEYRKGPEPYSSQTGQDKRGYRKLAAIDCPLDYLAVPGTDIVESLTEFGLDMELDSLRSHGPIDQGLSVGGGIEA
jgi:hypothetical protein